MVDLSFATAFRLLSEAMHAFAEASTDPKLLFDAIAERVGMALNAYCGFALVSDDRKWLTPTAVFDPDPKAKEIIKTLTSNSPLRMDEPSPLTLLLNTDERTLISPVPVELLRARFSSAEDLSAILALNFQCILVVPLRSRGETLGALLLIRHGTNVRAFDDTEGALAQSLAEHAALAISNARLLIHAQTELAERHRFEGRLHTLTALAHEFATATSNYQRLLDLVTRRLAEVNGSACMLRFVSDDGQSLEVSGGMYHPDPKVESDVRTLMMSSPQKMGEGVAGRVAATGQPMLLPHIAPEHIQSLVREDHRPLIESLHIKSVMAVPLHSYGKVIGVVTVVRMGDGEPYKSDDLRLFQEMATHAALAITNARLLAKGQRELSERRRMTDRLRVLSDLSQEFSAATEDYRSLLNLVAQRLGTVVGDACVIRMLVDGTDMFEPIGAIHHIDPSVVEAVREAMLAHPIRMGQGILGGVAASGKQVILPSVDTAKLAASVEGISRSMVSRLGITSLAAIPLFSAKRVVGAILIFRSDPTRPFSEDDQTLCQDLAVHASLAISNSRLLEQSKQALVQRMQTEEVLRRGFLEAAPDAVLIVNATGQIVLVNSQTETLFGYERSELLGQPIEVLVPQRFRPQHPAFRMEYIRSAVTRPMGEGRNLFALRKDGSEFSAEISLSPIETPDGTLVAAAIRDVTERRREMEDGNRRIQEANRLKSEFLANMSHELRTPLNAIIGFTALMHGGKAGPVSDVHKEYLGDILSSSRHLLQLINDVLDLAKVESGRMELRVEPVELSKLVNEVRDILRGLASEKRVRLEVDLSPEVPRVSVDARLLKQVLYNFLSNAIKFTDEGGQVALRVWPEPNDAFRIEVEDTGIGIKPEELALLFQEFQQLDSGTAKRYAGTGLGLALTKRIVEAQGGLVSARSTWGKGSTFIAVLPRQVKVEARGEPTVAHSHKQVT